MWWRRSCGGRVSAYRGNADDIPVLLNCCNRDHKHSRTDPPIYDSWHWVEGCPGRVRAAGMPLAEFNAIINGRRRGISAWLLGSGVVKQLAGRELPYLEPESIHLVEPHTERPA